MFIIIGNSLAFRRILSMTPCQNLAEVWNDEAYLTRRCTVTYVQAIVNTAQPLFNCFAFRGIGNRWPQPPRTWVMPRSTLDGDVTTGYYADDDRRSEEGEDNPILIFGDEWRHWNQLLRCVGSGKVDHAEVDKCWMRAPTLKRNLLFSTCPVMGLWHCVPRSAVYRKIVAVMRRDSIVFVDVFWYFSACGQPVDPNVDSRSVYFFVTLGFFDVLRGSWGNGSP